MPATAIAPVIPAATVRIGPNAAAHSSDSNTGGERWRNPCPSPRPVRRTHARTPACIWEICSASRPMAPLVISNVKFWQRPRLVSERRPRKLIALARQPQSSRRRDAHLSARVPVVLDDSTHGSPHDTGRARRSAACCIVMREVPLRGISAHAANGAWSEETHCPWPVGLLDDRSRVRAIERIDRDDRRMSVSKGPSSRWMWTFVVHAVDRDASQAVCHAWILGSTADALTQDLAQLRSHTASDDVLNALLSFAPRCTGRLKVPGFCHPLSGDVRLHFAQLCRADDRRMRCGAWPLEGGACFRFICLERRSTSPTRILRSCPVTSTAGRPR
jgi:hypothetical protein